MNPQLFSLQHIVDGQGIDIAIAGMVIVFCVLTLITLFISVLPNILLIIAKKLPEVETEIASVSQSSSNGDEAEILAAIGFVLHSRIQGRG